LLLGLVLVVGSVYAWERWRVSQALVTDASGSPSPPDDGITSPPISAEQEPGPRANGAGEVGDDGPNQPPSGNGRTNPLAPPLQPAALEDDAKPELAVASGILPPPNQLDDVVDGFILQAVGQLPGAKGKEALSAFDRLGTESVPALIRGLNRAASLRPSSPVTVLTEKLQGVLRSCRPEMMELAIGQLGVGVSATGPHHHHLENLKQQLLARLPVDHPFRRRIELAKRLSENPAQIPAYVRSDDPNDRWAAARAIFICGAPMEEELTRLVGDSEPVIIQEARAALVRLGGDEDFGPEPDADAAERESALADWRSWWFQRSNNAVFRRVSKMTDKEVREALKSQDAEERWAAVVTVGSRRLSYSGELIDLLRDSDRAVRRDARRTLIQFAEGLDFGPAEDATSQAVDEAVAKWQRWRRLHELIQAVEAKSPDELIAAFARPDPMERLAAVRVARARKLDRPEEFILALNDPQPEICQEARHALLQISEGLDFGPSENAGQEAVQEAVACWQGWLRRHRLVVALESKEDAEVVEAFQSEEPLERWAAVSASRRKGLRSGAKLIPLLRDSSVEVQQEARQALVELGGGEYDFGPPEQADPSAVDRAVTRWTTWWEREEMLMRLLDLAVPDLAVSFASSDVAERWAAATVARRRRAPLEEELIQLVRDPEEDVRQEARRALVQLAGGSDFGPPEAAGPQSIAESASQWERWWVEGREAAADDALKLAKAVLGRNPNAGRRRLQEIISEFAGTRAAQAAQNLLNGPPEIGSPRHIE
jgi:hypothetical protein